MAYAAAIRELTDKLRELELVSVSAQDPRLIDAYKQVIGDLQTTPGKRLPTRQERAQALRDEMVTVLNEAKVPLSYLEIFARLKSRGAQIPGKDPAKNINAHLGADQRFEKRNGNWGIRSWEKLGDKYEEHIKSLDLEAPIILPARSRTRPE